MAKSKTDKSEADWWEEDADRLNAMAEYAKRKRLTIDVGNRHPPALEEDGSLTDNSNPEGCNQYKGCGSRRGEVTRGGSPNARPAEGQWSSDATLKSGSTRPDEPTPTKAKKPKRQVEDDPEAARLYEESHQRHLQRVAASKASDKDSFDKLGEHQASYEQHEKELADLGIVETATGGFGFRKRRPAANSNPNHDDHGRFATSDSSKHSKAQEAAHAIEHTGHEAHSAHELHEVIEEAHHAAGHAAEHALHGLEQATGHGTEQAVAHGLEHGAEHSSEFPIHSSLDASAIAVAPHVHAIATATLSALEKVPGLSTAAHRLADLHDKANDLAESVIGKMNSRYGHATTAAILSSGAFVAAAARNSVGLGGPIGKLIPGQKLIGALPLLALAETGKRAGLLGGGSSVEKVLKKVGSIVHGVREAIERPFVAAASHLGELGLKAARESGRITRAGQEAFVGGFANLITGNEEVYYDALGNVVDVEKVAEELLAGLNSAWSKVVKDYDASATHEVTDADLVD